MAVEKIDDKSMEDPVVINDSEIGSAFGWDDVFGGWDDGRVFAYDDARVRDFGDMLDKDGKAAGIEKLLSYPIIAASHEITGAKGDKGEKDHIEEVFDKMETSLEELIGLMTFAFTIKRQYFEKVHEVRDRKVVYKDIAWRPPETCELALDDKTGRYLGFRQLPMWYGRNPMSSSSSSNKYMDRGWIDYPLNKAFVYTHGRWRDPILGISGMQVPYFCYITKQKIRYLWYKFLGTRSLPWVVVKNKDDGKARTAARKVATLRSSGVLGLQDNNEVDVLEGSGRGAEQFEAAIRFLDSEMSQSVLGGFMDLTQQSAEGKGSYALSADQSKLYLRTRQFVARDLAAQVQRQLIRPLCLYNFGTDAAIPSLTFGPLSDSNEQEVLKLFGQIATTGANVSQEFYHELTTRVASLLELDTGKVQKDIEHNGINSLDRMAGTVDNAYQLVRNHEDQQNSSERDGKYDLEPHPPAEPVQTNPQAK